MAKVNTDDVPELGQRYTIRSIPTMAVFYQGREMARTSGARPAAAIQAFVDEALMGGVLVNQVEPVRPFGDQVGIRYLADRAQQGDARASARRCWGNSGARESFNT